jgi:hypothetical protein
MKLVMNEDAAIAGIYQETFAEIKRDREADM